jgi:NhaA family Na+:H+ antiporter
VGRALPPIRDEFVSIEALGGIVLLTATFAALVWANVAPGVYSDVWSHTLTLGVGDAALSLSTHAWVNDGLMAFFFFVVGLEIKREVVTGELRDPKRAALPAVAALGGMLVPAALFALVNLGGDGSGGWGIPMATDIAFAVGVLAILGSHAPRGLKLFLLTLAIIDDIGAIVVIAIFYSSGIDAGWLAAALGVLVVIYVLQRWNVAPPLAYVVPALALWVCVHESGIHATIAGVVLGLLTPATPFRERKVLEKLEHGLHPWSSFAVIPVFALANAGVVFGGDALRAAASAPVVWGIVAGLLVGKTVGIAGATALAVRFRIGVLPDDVTFRHVVGAGLIAGIGFTVSLFIADLSFDGGLLEQAKYGILAGSAASGMLGAVWLWRTNVARR